MMTESGGKGSVQKTIIASVYYCIWMILTVSFPVEIPAEGATLITYSEIRHWNSLSSAGKKHTSLPLPGLKLTMMLMCHLCEAFCHFSMYKLVLLVKMAEFLSAAEHETKTK